jgi:hypothetical protein
MIIYNDDRDYPPVDTESDDGYEDAQENKRLEKKEEDYDIQ